jgi:hypothetical protein
MTKPPRARLFVLLARQASIGVILRRGPSDWVQMIKWHTDTDKFEEGQWLRGKVEEYAGDLSPDGKLLLYRVFHKRLYYKLEAQNREADKLLYYTAVSKSPYFTALELWDIIRSPGGKFVDNETLDIYPYISVPVEHIVNAATPLKVTFQKFDIEWTGPFITEKNVFMTNNNWKTQQIGQYVMGKLDPPHIWSKSTDNLSLYASHVGHDSDQKQSGARNQFAYSISIDGGKTEILLKGVNWADFDQQGRLVLAKEGKLFAGTLANGDLQLIELSDFNDNKPDPQPAPDWAQKW